MSFVEYMPNRALDVVPVGRAGIDLNCQTNNAPFKDNSVYVKTVGGSPALIAQGSALLGLRVGFIGKVAGNGMGDYVKETFENLSIDTGHLLFDKTGADNCLSVTEILAPKQSGSYMYRNGTADTLLSADEIDESYIANAAAVVVSGTALSIEPTRTAMFKVAEYAKKHGTLLIVDIDFRPFGWASDEETSLVYHKILSITDIIIGNREEFNAVELTTMPGNTDNAASAKAYLDKCAQLVIIKDGPKGSMAYTKDNKPVRCSIIDKPIKKTFGSGDAYASGVLYGLFNDYSLIQAMELGSACAAITLMGLTCGNDMPNLHQVKKFMSENTFEEVHTS